MLKVFHLDVVKVDLDVAHVAVGPILQSPPAAAARSPACTWVWRGRHSAGVGHEARVDHGAGAGTKRRGTRGGAGLHGKQGVRTLA